MMSLDSQQVIIVVKGVPKLIDVELGSIRDGGRSQFSACKVLVVPIIVSVVLRAAIVSKVKIQLRKLLWLIRRRSLGTLVVAHVAN